MAVKKLSPTDCMSCHSLCHMTNQLCHMTMQGFYMVYGDVFRRIAEEESQYAVEGEERLPEFGMLVMSFIITSLTTLPSSTLHPPPIGLSTSDYEEVIHHTLHPYCCHGNMTSFKAPPTWSRLDAGCPCVLLLLDELFNSEILRLGRCARFEICSKQAGSKGNGEGE